MCLFIVLAILILPVHMFTDKQPAFATILINPTTPSALEYADITPHNTIMAGSWAELRNAVDISAGPTTIEILNDITLPTGAAGNAIIIPVGHDITITGGFNLMRLAAGQRHFIVNGNLHIENITLSGNYPNIIANHGGILVNAGGSLSMAANSAIINNCATHGAGVHVTGANAQFTMDGGEISGNHAPAPPGAGGAGGVFIENSAVFIMNNGIIHNNGGRLGGGIRIGTATVSNTRMYMYGGEIYGNTGSLGGGINVEHGTLIMEGGVIYNNTATGISNTGAALAANRGGGGVFIQNGGRFYMDGGIIDSNHSDQRGGGVHVLGGVFTMNYGTISNNTAHNMGTLAPTHNTGGGVAVQTNALFNMSGGIVTDNTAEMDGGGIWLDSGTPTTGSRLNMTDGIISNNTATTGDGGGIFATPTSTENILPITAYQNIISAEGVFMDNTAGGGGFAPPLNSYTRPFGHLLINDEINFRGPNRVVIFDLNGGNVAGDTDAIIHFLPQGAEIGTNNVPDVQRPHHSFAGWRYYGQVAGTLTSGEVASHTVTESIMFIAEWIQITHTVTFDLEGGDVGGNPANIVYELPEGSAVNAANVPAPVREYYNLIGWRQYDGGDILSSLGVGGIVVNGDLTFTAIWETLPGYGIPQPTLTPTPTSTPYPQLTSTPLPTSTILPTSTPKPSPILRPSSSPQTNTQLPASASTVRPTPFTESESPLPPPLEIYPQPEIFFHEKFMIGYPDGTFRPNNYITRAEAAALLVRTIMPALQINSPAAAFSDVSPNAWYYDYINTAYTGGLIKGFPDGSFRPNSPITREQFAALLARTEEIHAGGILPYTDSADISYWALDYVYTALIAGLMHGDVAGTFRPLEPIKRAEAAAGMCRILGRGDTTSRSIYGMTNLTIFPDAADTSTWYFYYVLEATNSHWFVYYGGEEIWVEVINTH